MDVYSVTLFVYMNPIFDKLFHVLYHYSLGLQLLFLWSPLLIPCVYGQLLPNCVYMLVSHICNEKYCISTISFNNNIRVSIFLFLWQEYLVFRTCCRWCIYLRFRKWSMSLANPARHGRKASEDAPLLVWSWWSTEQKPARWVMDS